MIVEVELENVPKNVLAYLNEPLPKFIEIYAGNGMFDPYKTDWLFVIEIHEEVNSWRCAGYVYNGTAPECSEWGGFGLNITKTKRIW